MHFWICIHRIGLQSEKDHQEPSGPHLDLGINSWSALKPSQANIMWLRKHAAQPDSNPYPWPDPQPLELKALFRDLPLKPQYKTVLSACQILQPLVSPADSDLPTISPHTQQKQQRQMASKEAAQQQRTVMLTAIAQNWVSSILLKYHIYLIPTLFNLHRGTILLF